jgi:hypothetical protein
MSKATKAKQPKAQEPAKREPEKLMIDGRYIRDGEIEKVKGAGDAAIAAFSDKLPRCSR